MNVKAVLLSVASLFLASLVPMLPAYAGECFVGSVQTLNGTVTTGVNGVRLRNNACMDQSTVLDTVPAKTSVTVLGEWDGWYKVQYNGAQGWIFGDYVGKVSATKGATSEYKIFEAAHLSGAITIVSATPSGSPVIGGSLLNRTKGYILLQVESHGEAWYVDPVSAKRFYMKDGTTAYEMMRSFGLGVTESDYAKLVAGNQSMLTRLSGRIVLRVQAHGEAYYILPKDLSMHYLQNGDEAYRIMRELSMGITTKDLSTLPSGGDVPVVAATSPSASATVSAPVLKVVQPIATNVLAPAAALSGWKPPHVNTASLTTRILAAINKTRTAKGLGALAQNSSLMSAAASWAASEGVHADETVGRSGTPLQTWLTSKNVALGDGSPIEYVVTDYVADEQADANVMIDRVYDGLSKGPEASDALNAPSNAFGIGYYFGKLTYSNSRIFIVMEFASVQ